MEESYDVPSIDGCPVRKKEVKERASACEICDFHSWEAGDVKYVIAHDENEDCCHDAFGYREHLCPLCTVKQGLPTKYYHQNKNAPLMDEAALAKIDLEIANKKKMKELSKLICDSCGQAADTKSISDNNNKKTLHGFVTVQSTADSTITCLCLGCAIEKEMLPFPEKSEASKKRRAV